MMGKLNWLASYPRSGNTWTRFLLRTIMMGRPINLDELDGFARMAVQRSQVDTLLECDSGMLKPAEIQKLRPDLHAVLADADPGIMVKVHDAWTRVDGRPLYDPAITDRTLYIIRDPRDVAVSWASFDEISLDQAIDFLANPDAVIGPRDQRIGPLLPQYPGTWSTNATGWIDESGLNPLVVRYEDMLADTPTAIRRIAAHLGVPADEAGVAMAVEATRFDRMAAMERASGFPERPRNIESPFFRSGRSNGWRDVLSPAQAARVRSDHCKVMDRFGYS